MKVDRRIALAIGAALMLFAPPAAADYPDRPITMIVPFGAGGTTDVIARSLAGALEPALGQKIVVINKDGAAGVIGTTELGRSKADGYTIGMIPVGPLTTQPHLRELAYSVDSFDYICQAYSNPQVLIVTTDSPYKTLKDLIADAKAKPGQIRYGSSGPGTIPHLAMLDFVRKAGIDLTHVPGKGEADAFRSMLGGTVIGFPVHTGFVTANADRVRPLAIMAAQRRSEFPDLPTFKEAGLDVSFDVWGGLVAPKGLPADVRSKLEKACAAAQASAVYREQQTKLKMPPVSSTGAAFAAFVRAEFARNGNIIKDAGLRSKQ
ncbi:MAG: tripartite tricarboxylate transporter substrate binding protein [Hyphomicrobiaceae bacterium]|nr:MAG: tripartite tricarboxylate transporter substrate binding protein [Hyphomicrobiaceae bacterium]